MATGNLSKLKILSVLKGTDENIFEGILVCSNSRCLGEYPVIDGIPVIVPDVRTYISHNILSILQRIDLSPPMESLLGDCCGPASVFNSQRQHISTYAFDHYGDLVPVQELQDSLANNSSSVKELLLRGIGLLSGKQICAPVIDIGCSVGRTSFELAGITTGLVLGIDLNFGMLKTASKILECGRLTYAQRQAGIVFEQIEAPVVFEHSHNLDFWLCDALCLPFGDEAFGLAISLNVLDCLNSPYDHLKELVRILKPHNEAIISTPYDWTINATPLESWLGGHSQRSEKHGNCEAMLRSLLANGGHPNALEQLEFISEIRDIPWHLRLYGRGYMKYLVHMLLVRKKAISF